MILSEKIIKLRKRNGWSQEELAEKLNVTRQSVSKWEGSQSVPDINKIIQMSQIFGVSVDYLVKEDIPDNFVDINDNNDSVKYLSLKQANRFLQLKEEAAKTISFGVFLCIISPIVLIILSTFIEDGYLNINEDLGITIGMIVLLVLVSVAVSLFVKEGLKLRDFEFIEKEIFESEHGVKEMARDKKKQHQADYTKNTISGIVMLILSSIPIFLVNAIDKNNQILSSIMVCLLLVIVGFALIRLIKTNIINGSIMQLLEEGDYTRLNKKKNKWIGPISGAYWSLIVAIFLGYSLITNNWGMSWIIWPVAGVLFGATIIIINLIIKDEKI